MHLRQTGQSLLMEATLFDTVPDFMSIADLVMTNSVKVEFRRWPATDRQHSHSMPLPCVQQYNKVFCKYIDRKNNKLQRRM